MARKPEPTTSLSPNLASQSISVSSQPPSEVADLLAKVTLLIRDGQPQKALDLLRRATTSSPWLNNAVGVCLLRLGQAQAAQDVLRGLVLGVGITLKPDAAPIFKTNFATALLLTDNLSGCLSALADVNDEQNPAVQRLRGAINRWKQSLPFWEKIQWYLGGHPTRKVELDFPPGDL